MPYHLNNERVTKNVRAHPRHEASPLRLFMCTLSRRDAGPHLPVKPSTCMSSFYKGKKEKVSQRHQKLTYTRSDRATALSRFSTQTAAGLHRTRSDIPRQTALSLFVHKEAQHDTQGPSTNDDDAVHTGERIRQPPQRLGSQRARGSPNRAGSP